MLETKRSPDARWIVPKSNPFVARIGTILQRYGRVTRDSEPERPRHRPSAKPLAKYCAEYLLHPPIAPHPQHYEQHARNTADHRPRDSQVAEVASHKGTGNLKSGEIISLGQLAKCPPANKVMVNQLRVFSHELSSRNRIAKDTPR
jgi:hypothetical protein